MASELMKSGEVVEAINPNDVLLGRGAGVVNHQGNLLLRKLVRAKLAEYLSASKKQTKDTLARQIVQEINEQKGRFLRNRAEQSNQTICRSEQKDDAEDVWETVDMETVLIKVKQTFRDENPTRRRRQADTAAKKLAARSRGSTVEQESIRAELLPGIRTECDDPADSTEQSTSLQRRLQQSTFSMQQEQSPTFLMSSSQPASLQYATLLEQERALQQRRQAHEEAAYRQLRVPTNNFLESQIQQHALPSSLPFPRTTRMSMDLEIQHAHDQYLDFRQAREALLQRSLRSTSLLSPQPQVNQSASVYGVSDDLLPSESALLDQLQRMRPQSLHSPSLAQGSAGSLANDQIRRLQLLRRSRETSLHSNHGTITNVLADDPLVQARVNQLRGLHNLATSSGTNSISEDEVMRARLRHLRQSPGVPEASRDSAAVTGALPDDALLQERLRRLRSSAQFPRP